MTRDEAIAALRRHRTALDEMAAFYGDVQPDLDAPFDDAEQAALEATQETAERARDAGAWLLEHVERTEFDRIIRDQLHQLGGDHEPA
jgi:hypothetical protein